MQSPSWDTNSFAASQEIPRISRNPKVHYRTHKRPSPVSVLGQPNPHKHTLYIYIYISWNKCLKKFLEFIFLLISWQIHLITVFFLLCDSPPASEFYVSTFRKHPVFSLFICAVSRRIAQKEGRNIQNGAKVRNQE